MSKYPHGYPPPGPYTPPYPPAYPPPQSSTWPPNYRNNSYPGEHREPRKASNRKGCGELLAEFALFALAIMAFVIVVYLSTGGRLGW